MKTNYLFITALMFAFAISEAQIPNFSFENWTNMGSYSDPAGWSNPNYMTAPMGVVTVEQGMPGNPGTYYLKLTSKNITGMGVMPGMALCGTFDQMTMQPSQGFPYSQRPQNLTGKCQHNNAQGYVEIELTKWDAMMQTRTTVAFVHYNFTGVTSGWTDFTIPVSYMTSANPDSAMIYFVASGNSPVINDFLYIDNLLFTGVTAIAENNADKISVYPNPSHNTIVADLSVVKGSKVNYEISDIQGKTVKSAAGVDASSHVSIDISDLQNGNYIIKIFSEKETFIKQFAKD